MVHGPSQVNLEATMLIGESSSQKDDPQVISLHVGPWRHQVPRDRKRAGGGRMLFAGHSFSLGERTILETDGGVRGTAS